MVDNTGDWCFEGGCTYVTNTDILVAKKEDADAVDVSWGEPCIASYD